MGTFDLTKTSSRHRELLFVIFYNTTTYQHA